MKINLFYMLKLHISKKYEISLLSNVRSNCYLEGRNRIMKFTTLSNSNIGFASYVGSHSSIINMNIGRYCSIGSNFKIVAGNHPTSKFISTHPLFYNRNKISGLSFNVESQFEEYSYINGKWCEIGNDVWIGNNVSVLNGVKIGDGAIIATGSVVVKDVDDYAIVGGVPAKLIKYRFSSKDIKSLKEIKWWENELEWIFEKSKYFDNIEKIENLK